MTGHRMVIEKYARSETDPAGQPLSEDRIECLEPGCYFSVPW